MIDLTDIDQWDDDEVEQTLIAVTREREKRSTLKTAEEQINRLVWAYSDASGRQAGDDWVQPTGAHNSYGSGMVVTHEGKQWVSTVPGNVWEPGVSGWREYVEEGSGVVPDFVPPTGAHDAYRTGEMVSFQGKVYRSLIDANVYSPNEYPAGWEEVVSDPSPVTDPEGSEPGDGEAGPSVPEFVQPTGAQDAYQIGDQVLFEGAVYESVIANNTYSPSAYPAGWKTV